MPDPTPPKMTSLSMIFTSGTIPPSGVNESCQPLIAPQLASVVTVANSAEFAIPNRVSLPSMLPPGCPLLTCWLTVAGYNGFPRDSAQYAVVTPAKKRIAMAPHTAQPCAGEFVIRPSVYVRPADTAKIENSSIKFEYGVGFSNGCALLALKNPPPLVPHSLMISCDATGPCAMVCVVTVSITGLPLPSTTGLPSAPTRCTCCGSTSFTVS